MYALIRGPLKADYGAGCEYAKGLGRHLSDAGTADTVASVVRDTIALCFRSKALPSEIDRHPHTEDQVVGILRTAPWVQHILEVRTQIQPASDMHIVEDFTDVFC